MVPWGGVGVALVREGVQGEGEPAVLRPKGEPSLLQLPARGGGQLFSPAQTAHTLLRRPP